MEKVEKIEKIEETVKAFIAGHHLLDHAHRIVLAVSGGADSMALAHFMTAVFPQYGYLIAHFNHGLRPEAAGDEELVRTFAESRGLDFYVARADIAALARERKQGIEETGREERYRFFKSLGADLILTAHHKNDVAETVLLHLIRGSGLKGVSGIAARENGIGRPFLPLAKEDLLAYCDAHGVAYAEDATNADTSYARNKIRHEVLPLLATVNPAVVDALSRFALIAAGDEAVLEDAARKFFTFFGASHSETLTLDRDGLGALAPSLARRVLRIAASEAGKEIDYETTTKILELDNGKKLPLTADLWVRLEGDVYCFTPEAGTPPQKIPPQPLPEEGKITLPALGLTVTTFPSGDQHKGDVKKGGLFPAELLEDGPLTVRTRAEGDHIVLPDGKTKKLSDYFIDEKIPAPERDRILLVAQGKRVLWVVGYRFFSSPGKNNIFVRIEDEKYSNN